MMGHSNIAKSLYDRIRQLEAALAAEREHVVDLTRSRNGLLKEREALRDDLAAEREAHRDTAGELTSCQSLADSWQRADRENAFKLAANQCDGPMTGDEHGHSYCPLVTAERERAERAEAQHKEALSWAESLRAQRQRCDAAYEAERARADALAARVESIRGSVLAERAAGEVSDAIRQVREALDCLLEAEAALSASSGEPEPWPSGECFGG